MTVHSFFTHRSLCLATKMNLLKKPLSSFNPRKQLFCCLHLDLVRQLLLNLIDASEFFLHHQLETNNFTKKNMIPITPFIFHVMSLDQLGCAGQIRYWKCALHCTKNKVSNYKDFFSVNMTKFAVSCGSGHIC